MTGRRRDYDMGDRQVADLILPIPAAFELELADGRRIEGGRDIEEGALRGSRPT